MSRQILASIATKFAHRVEFNYEPESIFDTIFVPIHPYSFQDLFTTLEAKTTRRKRNIILISKTIQLNTTAEKLVNPKSFKRKLVKF